MILKILKSVYSAAAVTILILAAIWTWTIPGFILAVLGLCWMVVEAFVASKKGLIYGLMPVVAFVVLGFALWLPIALVGYGVGALEIFFIFGAIASVINLAYAWGK